MRYVVMIICRRKHIPRTMITPKSSYFFIKKKESTKFTNKITKLMIGCTLNSPIDVNVYPKLDAIKTKIHTDKY